MLTGVVLARFPSPNFGIDGPARLRAGLGRSWRVSRSSDAASAAASTPPSALAAAAFPTVSTFRFRPSASSCIASPLLRQE
jgi:hypothetical protein